MPAPSPLAIASSAVRRLRKEVASYRKELADQEAALASLTNGGGDRDDDDGNKAFLVQQQRTAIEQTEAVFPPLQRRLRDAIDTLKKRIDENDGGEDSRAELEQARALLQEPDAA